MNSDYIIGYSTCYRVCLRYLPCLNCKIWLVYRKSATMDKGLPLATWWCWLLWWAWSATTWFFLPYHLFFFSTASIVVWRKVMHWILHLKNTCLPPRPEKLVVECFSFTASTKQLLPCKVVSLAFLALLIWDLDFATCLVV